MAKYRLVTYAVPIDQIEPDKDDAVTWRELVADGTAETFSDTLVEWDDK